MLYWYCIWPKWPLLTDQSVQTDLLIKPKIQVHRQIEDSKTHKIDINFTFLWFYFDFLWISEVQVLEIEILLFNMHILPSIPLRLIKLQRNRNKIPKMVKLGMKASDIHIFDSVIRNLPLINKIYDLKEWTNLISLWFIT